MAHQPEESPRSNAKDCATTRRADDGRNVGQTGRVGAPKLVAHEDEAIAE
jgi:hypothetical protein